MSYESKARYYRRSVDAALAEAFERMDGVRRTMGETSLDDDDVCMIALRDTLRHLANEADARLNIKAQTLSLLS